MREDTTSLNLALFDEKGVVSVHVSDHIIMCSNNYLQC
jgi:hypothetical protein